MAAHRVLNAALGSVRDAWGLRGIRGLPHILRGAFDANLGVPVEFRILGPLEVVGGGEPLALGSAQQRAVLALLLIRAPEPVSSDWLIDELWGENPPATAAHAVQVHVSGIRKALRAGGGDAAVRTSSSGYVLDLDPELVDARRFERLLDEAQRAVAKDPSLAGSRFEEALGLWRGAPLSEFEASELVLREAGRLQELRALALEGLVEARLACGEHGEVIGAITGLVEATPLRERPRRLLMLALYRSGRHAEALAAYRDACEALDELGLQPGPGLRQLEEAILRHDSSLITSTERDDAIVPEFTGPPRRDGRLPIAAYRLVGRRKDISAVAALFARRDVRLVTMLGPGGSGKTRLALEVATELAERYRDGVWFVSLASLTDPVLVASEVARTLGVKESPDAPVVVALASALERRELLLVLDNFEHLIPAAGLVSQLVETAPNLDVLVTSREPLRIRGEHRLEVLPLPLGDAAELFLERGRAIRPDLADDGQDREPVERICMRLDGLPLALELAAAGLTLFSVSALEARLAQRLSLPPGARDLPDRQRTLRATIDWSYQLLAPVEQALFRGFAVFAGGARMEAVESVLADSELDAIEAVTALVEKSLLRRRDDRDGQPRFWMLETIREYASDCLTSLGEAGAVAVRHARYFLAFAEDAELQIHTRDQATWLARLDADHGNLRAAFDQLIAQAPSDAVRIASALGYFWDIRGHLSESRDRFQRVLECPPTTGAAAAKARLFAGRFLVFQTEGGEPGPVLLDALRPAREAHDVRVEVLVLSLLAIVPSATGDGESQRNRHEEALAIARSADDNWILRHALNSTGDTLRGLGQMDRARSCLEEALELGRRIGEPMGIAQSAANLADLELECGNLQVAESLIEEIVRNAREIDYASMFGAAHATQAFLALHRGDRDLAATRVTESIEALRVAYHVFTAIILLAAAAAAAQLWAAFDTAKRRFGVGDACGAGRLRDEWLPKARATLDPTAWQAAWDAGAKLLPMEALELAVEN
jgi:predicted ATPase/DNA-binding SARP family transcriptional activator